MPTRTDVSSELAHLLMYNIHNITHISQLSSDFYNFVQILQIHIDIFVQPDGANSFRAAIIAVPQHT
jgi:hypothetical protein